MSYHKNMILHPSLIAKSLARQDAVDCGEDVQFLTRGALDELGTPRLDLCNVIRVFEVTTVDAGV